MMQVLFKDLQDPESFGLLPHKPYKPNVVFKYKHQAFGGILHTVNFTNNLFGQTHSEHFAVEFFHKSHVSFLLDASSDNKADQSVLKNYRNDLATISVLRLNRFFFLFI